MAKRKGNISFFILVIFILFALIVSLTVEIDRKTNSIKRQNIHNAVIAANLASYYAIETGDKDVCLSYNPTELKNYLKSPDTILTNGESIENVVNLINSEYFDSGERYKSIYIRQDKAYDYFSKSLKDNLNITEKTKYYFEPIDGENNKAKIVSLKVNDFEVYNAIYKDMSNIQYSNVVKEEKRKYTGIHLDLNACVQRTATFKTVSNTVNVPIHIDTEVTLFRPILN